MENEIDVAYDKAKKDLSDLIDFLECELEKEPKYMNWGYVGDLNRIKESLTETLTSVLDFKKGEIEDKLQDM